MKSIGENINRLRKDQNMTQEELANKLGITPQALSKWERGVSFPDVTLIADICRVLKVRADTLLGMEGVPFCEDENVAVEQEIKQNLIAEPLCLEIGVGLVPCVVEGLKTDYVNQCRKKLAAQTGMLLPIIRIRDAEDLEEKEICIKSYDRILLQRKCSETDQKTYYDMIDDVVRLCKENYGRILNKQLVKSMLDNLQEQYPGVLDGLMPERVGYYEVMGHLRKVIEEKGNIRDLIHIVEELEENLKKQGRY